MSEIDIERVKHRLRVVVASPGDVQRERDSLRDILDTLNKGVADTWGYHLEFCRWETDAYPRFHADGPQGAIDSSLRIQDCDILICIFWRKLGTPVRGANSGTEHELQIAYEAWRKSGRRPVVMLYFNTRGFLPKTDSDKSQFDRVWELKRTIARKALYRDYHGLSDFRNRVTSDLTQVIRDMEHYDPRRGDARVSLSEPRLRRALNCDWRSLELGGVPLHTFYGLRRDLRSDDLLQDFRIDRQRYTNPSPVSYLWADVCRGSSINASIAETEPPHLCVTFENKPCGWPCNLALRPIGGQAVKTRGRPILALEARVAPEVGASPNALSEVYVSARVVNGWCQHWVYGPGPGRYRLLQVGEAWSPLEIPLVSADWWLSSCDGNHCFGPDEHDFSIIASLVLEFGGDGIDRPGPGHATVFLRNVHLEDRSTRRLVSCGARKTPATPASVDRLATHRGLTPFPTKRDRAYDPSSRRGVRIDDGAAYRPH